MRDLMCSYRLDKSVELAPSVGLLPTAPLDMNIIATVLNGFHTMA